MLEVCAPPLIRQGQVCSSGAPALRHPEQLRSGWSRWEGRECRGTPCRWLRGLAGLRGTARQLEPRLPRARGPRSLPGVPVVTPGSEVGLIRRRGHLNRGVLPPLSLDQQALPLCEEDGGGDFLRNRLHREGFGERGGSG